MIDIDLPKWRARYSSWDNEQQRYIECSFPVYAKTEKEAYIIATDTLRIMEQDDSEFSYINLLVEAPAGMVRQ